MFTLCAYRKGSVNATIYDALRVRREEHPLVARVSGNGPNADTSLFRDGVRVYSTLYLTDAEERALEAETE